MSVLGLINPGKYIVLFAPAEDHSLPVRRVRPRRIGGWGHPHRSRHSWRLRKCRQAHGDQSESDACHRLRMVPGSVLGSRLRNTDEADITDKT